MNQLKMCFHGSKHKKINHLRERLKLAQVVIINYKVMKLRQKLKGQKQSKYWS